MLSTIYLISTGIKVDTGISGEHTHAQELIHQRAYMFVAHQRAIILDTDGKR